MDISLFLVLGYLGLVMIAQAKDCSRPTLSSNTNLNDDDLLKDTFPDGSKANLVCALGYQWKGGLQYVTCTDGVWSPVTIKCDKISCGAAEEVEHGIVGYPNGVDFGAQLSITCNRGYILVGAAQRTCLSDGSWSNHPPRCIAVTCDPPPKVAQGNFNPLMDVYQYDDIVQYSCDQGYVLNGSKLRHCSDDGQFKPGPPVCVEVNCRELEIINAEMVSGARPPYGYMASVTFECISGYEMVGSSTVTCDINSRWLPKLPSCKRKESPKPTTTVTTVTTPKTKMTPTASSEPDPETGNKNDGSHLGMSLGIAFAVIIGLAIAIIIGCYYFGCLAFINKKSKNGDGRTPAGTTLLEMGRGL
ncbi:membrane cofactor protein isoform X3 [Syngnathus scovelli]|uniref:membrane cofactor protein isoform X3 n=1 Tax=Syngnathus scovelli TaxID=161590 RepID=UPI00211008D3|nr:membrane cofactor protein isoform X3 [Syngnathus scovelli]